MKFKTKQFKDACRANGSPSKQEIASMSRLFSRPLSEGRIADALEFMRAPSMGAISSAEKLHGVGALLKCELSEGRNPYMDGKIAKNAAKALCEFIKGDSKCEERCTAAKIQLRHLLDENQDVRKVAAMVWNSLVRNGTQEIYANALHELFYAEKMENARLALDAITLKMVEKTGSKAGLAPAPNYPVPAL